MFYLGVDGGGTKTCFVLIDEDCRIVARTNKGASNYVQVGLENAAAVNAAGVTEICALGGIRPEEIAYSFWGLPAYGEIEKDIPLLETMVRAILGPGRFRCGNDVEAGWAGSLACRPGIHLTAGTGAIGFGRDPEGTTARAGGWGEFFGDEGSAYWLGKRLISLFAKQADGREQRTMLYEIVRREFNLARDLDFISIISEKLHFRRDAIARLALLVYAAALQGDAKALALFDEAALENSLTVRALLHRLVFPPDEEVTVSYTGGVFRAGDLILVPLRRYLAGERVRLVPPLLQPATGAALYAMILHGRTIPEGMVDRLQEQEAMMDNG